LNLGFHVVPSVDVKLLAFREYGWPIKRAFFFPHWDAVGVLWDAAGNSILSVPFNSLVGTDPTGLPDAWRNHWIHPRYPLLAGVEYVVSVWLYRERYGVTFGTFAAPYTVGPLTVPAPGGVPSSGVYVYAGGLTFPTQQFIAGTAYGVDIIVE